MVRGFATVARIPAALLRQWRRRHGREFARDEQGATAIEFGLLAVPFFSILAAIMETSLVFLSGQVLDSAVQDVSRLIRTGQADSASMTKAQLKALICDRLYNLFRDCEDGDNLHVEIGVVNPFAAADISPPVLWTCATGQTAADCAKWTRPETYTNGAKSNIITVQVYYKWPIIVPFGGLGLGNLPDGRRLLGAATVFRNEPF